MVDYVPMKRKTILPSNCLFWALKQKLLYGGFIKIVKTPGYSYVPRTFWSKDKKQWYRFTPLNPVKHPTTLQNLFPLHVILFKGKVIRCNLPQQY